MSEANALNNLEKNEVYLKQNFDHLLSIYKDKWVLVHEEKVVGSFDSYAVAANTGVRQYGLYSGFLVEQITEKYTTIFAVTAI